MPIYIKFFSGSQKDSILELEKNIFYSVGNSYNCNIYIADDITNHETTYFNFIINDESLIFNDISVQLLKNSCVLIVEKEPNNLPIFFTLNNIKIGIGTQDNLEYWPEINFSDIPETQDSTSNLLLDNDIQSKVPTKYDGYIGFIKNILHKQLIKLFVQIKSFWQRYPLYTIVLIFLFIVLISCFIVSTRYKTIQQNETTQLSVDYDNPKIQSLRKIFMQISYRYSLLSLNKDSSGRYNLLGLVTNNDDIQFLKNYFNKYNDILNYQITTISNAIMAINVILADNNNGKLIASFNDNTKKIKITGIISDSSILDDLQLKINNKVAGLGELDLSQIYDLQQINNDITNIVGNNKDSITINNSLLIDYGVKFNGFLEQDKLSELKKQIEDFKERYPIIKVTLNVKDIYNSLPFHIYSVYNGNPSFIILDTGKKIFVGSEVNGYRLSSIDETKAVFVGKYTIAIPLDQLDSNVSDTNDSDIKHKSLKTSNDHTVNNRRDELLKEESDKLQTALNNELSQLDELNKYKVKFINDKAISGFINKQIDNLQQDIDFKQHELDTYSM